MHERGIFVRHCFGGDPFSTFTEDFEAPVYMKPASKATEKSIPRDAGMEHKHPAVQLEPCDSSAVSCFMRMDRTAIILPQ